MAFQHIIPARLEFAEDGTPYSSTYGDVYHAASGALDQARHVFLGGNGLPQRWQDDAHRERFVIVETGFGLGHNFLATWQAWRETPQRCERLHFISVEKHPFSAEDMRRAHASAGVPPELSAQLLENWPLPLPGFHRIELDGDSVVLTLLFGDADALLARCVARVDAIFLDGFSPARNVDMWSQTVFDALASLSHSGTTLSTWSVSGSVRNGLTAAGFEVRKSEGFAAKRQMLTGRYPKDLCDARATIDRRTIVIGAGLAGTAIAERLAVRGWTITLLDAGNDIASGASGNLAGAFRPLPSADDNLMARLTRAGYLYQLRNLSRLSASGHPVRWSQCGVLHVARDARQEARLKETVEILAPSEAFVQWLDEDAASRRVGQSCMFGAWWFPDGGWIAPPSLCRANLCKAGDSVDVKFNARIERITHMDGMWQAFDVAGTVIAKAPHLVLANAHDARRLSGESALSLRGARGQTSHVPEPHLGKIDTVVCGSGYVTPAIDGLHSLGASFVVDDASTELRKEEHAENFAKLGKMLKDANGSNNDVCIEMQGRASVRPITTDRLPVVGALSREGLWLISGFGARGLVWGNLCAELLASQMNSDPLPLERDLVLALKPIRTSRRQA